ncbi:ABC transporter ATP-binding protein [Natranaerofaba carboxydovora]|uniref:ABC transporter ATP-binding protein n=1 Tax=Natranaerofaba carboxydovora TaxID=2742683 RepID=UPI001F146BDA|nr:ABC transporter ATP-binding protein [Natranaerofaba carboxydovora]UMZ72932.1 putative ABC transporter ATP-binding protein YknY [Natranaerofaba carboxydovora]
MVIKLKNVSKIYKMGEVDVKALKNVNLTIEESEFVSIIGPSGSGKSTLMNIMGCLDVPTFGEYWLNGYEVSKLSDNQLAGIRNLEIGFVFQSFNLFPKLTALDNVMRPLIYRKITKKEQLERSIEALKKVGLEDRTNHRPNQLSGGQQQRVAIARALVGDPSIILADEPTGNLDTKSGEEVLKYLTELNNRGKTLVLISHDPKAASHAKRHLKIIDGEITPTKIEKEMTY